jgi:ATP-dependent RNA circularization protein (DNA/RNA ligase family)
MTVYLMKGEFGVCSRNMDLKETEGNSFWATARKDDIEAKMRAVDEYWDFAIQGELIGPGIQGNIYNLKETEFRVFDVYNIQTGEYLKPAARRDLIGWMDLKHVPVIAATADMYDTLGLTDIPQLLGFAEGKSVLGDTEREGVVFKQVDGGMSFKAISNKYLLGEK